jgi:phage protein D
MKPIFKIEADDQDITDLISKRLISLNVFDETGLISDRAEILLDNREDVLEIPPRGTTLKIHLGYEGQFPSKPDLTFMGSFIVDNISLSSPPSKMRIIAKASYANDKNLSNKIRSPKSRSWHEYSLVGIISKIVGEHQFKPLIDEYFNKIYISHLDQTSESDLSFLVGLAQNYDALIKFVDGRLIFARKSAGLSISGKELPTAKIFKNQISNWRLEILDRGKFGKVIAKYHDFVSAKEKQISIGSDEPAYEMRFTFTDEQRAKSAATAKLAEFSRGISKLEISLAGDPKLFAEGKISIPDIRYLKGKIWIISSVNHQLNDQGYKSTISAAIKT